MNAPTKETLRAEALEVKRLVIEFGIYTKHDNADAASGKAAEIIRMVRSRPILEGMAADMASGLIENAGTWLGDKANVGIANLMLRLHREAGEVMGRRLEYKKAFPVRRQERIEAPQRIGRLTP